MPIRRQNPASRSDRLFAKLVRLAAPTPGKDYHYCH